MKTFIAVAAFALSTSAYGQDAPVVLWSGLAVGDDQISASAKLSALPEIKKAKPKDKISSDGAGVSISYRGDGFDIMGNSFRVFPFFSSKGLSKVALSTESLCADKAFDQASHIMEVLGEKYSSSLILNDPISRSEISSAFANGTDEDPSIINRFRTDGRIVVMYQAVFTAEKAPPSVYPINSTVAALSRIAWNSYLVKSEECNGTGAHRLVHRIIYLSKQDFDEQMKAVDRENAEQIAKAKVRL